LTIEVFEIEERAPGKEAIRFVEKLEVQTGRAANPGDTDTLRASARRDRRQAPPISRVKQDSI